MKSSQDSDDLIALSKWMNELAKVKDLIASEFNLSIHLFPFVKKSDISYNLKKTFNCEDPRLFENNFIPQKILLNNREYLSSLTHCKDMGIFCVLDNSSASNAILGVGIDLEETSRITNQLISRIASKDEIENQSKSGSQWYKLLWPIKEASFKAIPLPQQPKVIGNIKLEHTDIKTSTISDHHSDPGGYSDYRSVEYFKFSCMTNKSASSQTGITIQGLSMELNNYVVALAFLYK